MNEDDSLFMETAADAGLRPLGVAYGYRPPAELHTAGAYIIFETFSALPGARDEAWGAAA